TSRPIRPCRGNVPSHVATGRGETILELQIGDEDDPNAPAALAASDEVRRHEVRVSGSDHVDVDVRPPAELASGHGPLEPEGAGAVRDHARAAAPVVAAVRAGLPELDGRPADRRAVRRAQDPAGEDVAAS